MNNWAWGEQLLLGIAVIICFGMLAYVVVGWW